MLLNGGPSYQWVIFSTPSPSMFQCSLDLPGRRIAQKIVRLIPVISLQQRNCLWQSILAAFMTCELWSQANVMRMAGVISLMRRVLLRKGLLRSLREGSKLPMQPNPVWLPTGRERRASSIAVPARGRTRRWTS